jgi:hypothetical protein
LKKLTKIKVVKILKKKRKYIQVSNWCPKFEIKKCWFIPAQCWKDG